jgi:hypothetical protein
LGERCIVFASLCYLFGYIPLGESVEALLVPLSSAGDLGSPPGNAKRSDLSPLSVPSGAYYNRADDLRVEQQSLVDF